MARIFTEKPFTRKWFVSYALIIAGSFILAGGFVFFITPYKFVPGGVYGVAIVIHYLTKGMLSFAPGGLPVGLTGLVLNIPLTIIGIRILGPRFGAKTVVGFVLSSVFMDLITGFWGDKPLVENDPLLSCIFGGVLVGFGLGLIFRSKATSGGSDIIAMILSKYTRLPLGMLMIYTDSVIVLIGLAAFASWAVPLYSWIIIFITGKVIDVVMQGLSSDKALFIISEKYEEIRDRIINSMGRGGTFIPGQGMYNGAPRTIIYTVVNRREISILEEYIHQIDPDAFVSVIEANEILGEGFKSLQEKVKQA
ncbi:MAG TPA: YitT family protein [Bacteroidales bacterium]|nr:YitT family protein [Bacteroidales bacterium]HSA43159.1 YitT family protein [Bacteroidales bacterium]